MDIAINLSSSGSTDVRNGNQPQSSAVEAPRFRFESFAREFDDRKWKLLRSENDKENQISKDKDRDSGIGMDSNEMSSSVDVSVETNNEFYSPRRKTPSVRTSISSPSQSHKSVSIPHRHWKKFLKDQADSNVVDNDQIMPQDLSIKRPPVSASPYTTPSMLLLPRQPLPRCETNLLTPSRRSYHHPQHNNMVSLPLIEIPFNCVTNFQSHTKLKASPNHHHQAIVSNENCSYFSNHHPFKCLDCNKTFSSAAAWSKHRSQQQPCNDCSTVSTTTLRTFACKHCHKAYTSLSALKMHIRTHTLPCRCETCGKSFSRPWLLQGHVRTHTGEKPFSCSHCARSFADKSNLRAHLQTHLQHKKYSCNFCHKTFSRMSLLAKHSDGGGCQRPPAYEEAECVQTLIGLSNATTIRA